MSGELFAAIAEFAGGYAVKASPSAILRKSRSTILADAADGRHRSSVTARVQAMENVLHRVLVGGFGAGAAMGATLPLRVCTLTKSS